jgi:FlaA1/EpsC-like NDP-sugar epimerase
MLRNKSIFISGGTGSFGQEFVRNIISKYKKFNRLIIFSRDEFKQYEMSKIFSPKKYPFIRYFLGDVRDTSRLRFALKEIDIVVHAAALKHVSAAEYDPFEFIKTNVLGAQNIIEACIANKVKKVIALSTDKAVSPINLYGATKLCSDKLFLAANNITGNNPTTFSIVRYGNVMSSRGSVIPYFLTLKKNKNILQSGWNIHSIEGLKKFFSKNKKKCKIFKFTQKNIFSGNEKDPVRSWTFKNAKNKNLITNGLSILQDQYWLKFY